MHRWSAFQEFLDDLKPILQSLLCRHGSQADAYGAWDLVTIDSKRRRGVIPTPRLRHSSVRFSARHASGRAGRRMSPEVFSIGVTIDVSPSLVMRGRFVT